MKRRTNRLERIADLIQQSLAEILLRRLQDTRFQRVTITGVTVSNDMAYARVHVSVLTDAVDTIDAIDVTEVKDVKEEIKSIVTALNQASKLIRQYLAKEVKLR